MRFTPEHEQIADTVRKFVAKEINPHVAEWEAAQEFPSHALFKKLGANDAEEKAIIEAERAFLGQPRD